MCAQSIRAHPHVHPIVAECCLLIMPCLNRTGAAACNPHWLVIRAPLMFSLLKFMGTSCYHSSPASFHSLWKCCHPCLSTSSTDFVNLKTQTVRQHSLPHECPESFSRLSNVCGHFFRLNETSRSLFFSLPRSFSFFPPLLFLIQMLTFVTSECDGALYACQRSSLLFPLLSPAGLVSDYQWRLNVWRQHWANFSISVCRIANYINKSSSLHEIWAAWLWPWRVQCKQCFSTTDSTPLHSTNVQQRRLSLVQ